jgi:hypothetical protein
LRAMKVTNGPNPRSSVVSDCAGIKGLRRPRGGSQLPRMGRPQPDRITRRG